MRGDCSIRIDGIGFHPDEIAACAQRQGLLSIEIDLAAPGVCQCRACRSDPKFNRAPAIGAPAATMSLPEIHGLLDQARQLGARRCFLADSEPGSHPELLQIIDAAIGAGMQVELFISAATITESIAEQLGQRNVAVILAVHALDRDLQNRLAGDDRSHDAVQAALLNLAQAGYGETGAPRLAIRIEICDDNLNEVPAIWRWARKRAFEPYVQVITPSGADGRSPKIVTPDRARALFEALGQIDAAEFQRQWATPPSLIGRSCKRHLFACHVTPCGTIFACVGLTIPLGSIRAEPLREILGQSEVLEDIRDHASRVKEPCRTCSRTVDCYGCRGSAYQLTGDYLAGDPMCWKADGVPIDALPTHAAKLVPHGESVRAIDQLVQLGERVVLARAVVQPGALLVDASGRLDELAFIEMIAQSFAASHAFHLSDEGRAAQKGMLLGVRNLVVSGEARAGDRLDVTVRKVTRFGDFGVIEGEVHRSDGALIATAEVKIWRPGGDVAQEMSP